MISQNMEKYPSGANPDSILTILVPTFNGERTIQRALTSIINEIETHGLTEIVQVLIAENCSTDRTKKIVEELSKEKSWIKLCQPSSHQSLEGNLRYAMQSVETPYVKILCDDDLFLDGFLVNLLEIVDNNWGVDLIVSSIIPLGEGSNRLPKSRMPHYQNSDGSPSFISLSDGAFGQLSTLCFKTASWFTSDNSPIFLNHKYYGLEFVGRVYHLIVFGACIFDDSELIEYDNGPKRWNMHHFDVFQVNCFHAALIFQLGSLEQGMFPNPTDWSDWLIRTKKGWLGQLLLDVIALRRTGLTVNDDSITKYIPPAAKEYFSLSFLLKCIDYLPPLLCTVIIKCYIAIKKIRLIGKPHRESD